MIKLEHLILASPGQTEFIIKEMKNPMNSWEKNNSNCYVGEGFVYYQIE